MSTVQLDAEAAQRYLQHLEHAGADLAPVMRAIAQELLAETEDNFAAEGRPKWAPLKNPSARRQGGKILQDRGQLAASVSADSGDDYAQVGTNRVYAAIHQFGGETGRGHKVTLPARPYLPMTAEHALQPEAEEAVLAVAMNHLRRAAGL